MTRFQRATLFADLDRRDLANPRAAGPRRPARRPSALVIKGYVVDPADGITLDGLLGAPREPAAPAPRGH